MVDLAVNVQRIAPGTELLSLAEVKEAHKIPEQVTVENGYLERLIAAARRYAEEYTGRTWGNATWRMTLDAFPASAGPIELRPTPLVSVESIKYDLDDVELTLDEDEYKVLTASGRIVPVDVWPETDDYDAVRVTFVAGYDDVDAQEQVVQAMLLQIGDWYMNREASPKGLSPAVKALLDTVWDGKL